MTTENGTGAHALDDDALFEQMASNAPVTTQEEPPVEVEVEPEPQAEEPEPVAQRQPIEQPTQQQEPHRVPLGELLDEREKRKELQRRLEEFERREKEREAAAKQQPAPDIFESPDEAIEYRAQRVVDPIQQKVNYLEQRLALADERFSRLQAEQEHGAETVQKALDAFKAYYEADPRARQVDLDQMRAHPHQYGVLVNWYQTQEAIRMYRDPKAVEERFLSDPAFLQRALERAQAAARGQAPVVSIPTARKSVTLPSVSQMGAAAPIGGVDAGEDDDALFERMAGMAKRK